MANHLEEIRSAIRTITDSVALIERHDTAPPVVHELRTIRDASKTIELHAEKLARDLKREKRRE